jgi:glycosyltransferase involved in cell wall biosynthesis
MPVCNEADVIVEVIDEWARDVFAYLQDGSELVFDDCSTDGTTELIQQASVAHRFVRLERSARDGFFASAMRLYRLAACPIVFFTDSDGQYIPADFWKIARHIGDHDMVHGAKTARKDPLYRVGSSFGFNTLVRVLFRSRCEDVNSAFRLIRREMLADVLPDISRLGLLPNAEMYIRAERLGYRIQNVSIRHRQRKFGKSRGIAPRTFVIECWRAFVGLWRLRADLGRGRYATIAARIDRPGSSEPRF